MKYSAVSAPKKRPSGPKLKRQTNLKRKVQETYIVEKIIAKRFLKGKWEYFVKWMDFPDSDNTWEPEAHFRTCRQMIDEYELKQGRGRTESVPTEIISRRPESASTKEAGSSNVKKEDIKEADVKKDEDDDLKAIDDEDENLKVAEEEDVALKENVSENEDSNTSDSTIKASPSQFPTPTAIPWVTETDHLVPVAVKGVLRSPTTNELVYYMEMGGYPNNWKEYPAAKAHKEFPQLLIEYLASKIVWVTREEHEEEPGCMEMDN